MLSLSCGRQRRRSWRFGLDDKRTESGRNAATERRDWLRLTHEADESEEGCTFTIRSLLYILNEDEEDCGCLILAKAWLLVNTKRTHTQSKNAFCLRWIVGNVGFLGDKIGSMRKDDAVWVRAERQEGISDAVWSHVICGHVFWHWLSLPIMVFITVMARHEVCGFPAGPEEASMWWHV